MPENEVRGNVWRTGREHIELGLTSGDVLAFRGFSS
jgi:hypothetical protein